MRMWSQGMRLIDYFDIDIYEITLSFIFCEMIE